MPTVELKRIPPLLRKRDVIRILGITRFTFEKVVRCGTLKSVTPQGMTKGLYRTIDVENVFGVKIDL